MGHTQTDRGGVEHHVGELFPRVGFIVTNLPLPNRAVVRFYNKRGTAEPWIEEGNRPRTGRDCRFHRVRANEVMLQLSVLAYNLSNLWRRLVLPRRIDNWSYQLAAAPGQRTGIGWVSEEMSENQAVPVQLDLDGNPLPVSEASGIADETLWRTRRPRCIRVPIQDGRIGNPNSDGSRVVAGTSLKARGESRWVNVR